MDIRSKKPGTISKLILLTLLVFFVQALLFKDIITNYFPTEDEFALLVNSTNLYGGMNPAEWLTIGFSKYFMVYPEWTPYYQNILRPLVNVVYFANSLLFSNNYGFYLLFSYLLNGIAFSLVYYISRRFLELSENFSIIAGILFLFNPALLGKFYFYPSFAFDLFAAVVAGIAIILMLKKKYLFVMLISLLALFLKETMMFMPVALCLTYIMLQKRDKNKVNFVLASSYLLLPIILWMVVRFSFGFEFAGASYTEHFTGLKFFGISIVQSLLSWPLGIPDRVEIIATIKNIMAMKFALVNWFYFIALVFNLFLNVFIIILSIRFIKTRGYLEMSSGYLVILTWLIIYYIMLIVLGLETRFGETFYLLLIPFAICIFLKKMSPTLKYTALAYLIFIVTYGMVSYFTLLGSDNIGTYNTKFSKSRELINTLKKADENSEKILLINDVSAGFGYEWLNKFVGSEKPITKINSLAGYNFLSKDKTGFSLKTETSGDSTNILVVLPGELQYQFEGIDQKSIEHEQGQWFKRNENINYRFPEEVITGTSKSTGAVLYDFGNKMDIKYNSTKKTAIVYFNPSISSYEVTYINN